MCWRETEALRRRQRLVQLHESKGLAMSELCERVGLSQSDESEPKRVFIPHSSFVLQGAARKANDLAGAPLGCG